MIVSRGSMFGLVGAMVFFGGCAGGRYYRMGSEAERQGKVHLAYENYCKAAAEHPESGTVVAAIKRVAPTAATYWESEALIAWSRGRHADSWRMAMRCLKIRPDHQGALHFVRKLESEHPDEIKPAKREWLAQGGRSLETAKAVTMEGIAGGAGEVPDTASTASEGSEALALADDPQSREGASGDSDQAKRPVTRPQSKSGSTNGADHGPSAPAIAQTATPKKTGSDREQAEDGAFLAIHTLSKDNKKYEREVLAIDGIRIRLRDTDGDPDTDLDLYDGKRRTQKIRDLKMGRSKMFRGHSGRWYRLTVLSIHHKSETVRIGIGPA